MLLRCERAEPAQQGFPAQLHLKQRSTAEVDHEAAIRPCADRQLRSRWSGSAKDCWGHRAPEAAPGQPSHGDGRRCRGEALPVRLMDGTCATRPQFPALAVFCMRIKGAAHRSKPKHMPKHLQHWRYLPVRHTARHKWVIASVSFSCNFMAEGI